MKRFSAARCGMMLVSMLPMALGATLFLLSGFGNDPFTGMNLAVAAFCKAALGPTQLCVNVLLFALVLLFDRKLFGLGTIINMVVIGYLIDFFKWLWLCVSPMPEALWLRALLLVGGVLVLSFGAALYFTADMGIAPYDATGFVVCARTPLAYAPSRMLTDLACVTVCLLFGGVVGVGTLVSALFLGPFITFFRKHVSEPVLAALEARREGVSV